MKKTITVLLTLVMLLATVSLIASAASLRKLDLAFVIDTTSSMSDDIDDVKQHMREYLNDLDGSGMDFRVAIIDYRDFSSRTGYSGDYPYRVQLEFSNEYEVISNKITALSLGDGGDGKETVYSALIDGLDELSWRDEAGKAAILIGDAPALEPEPITGYIYDMVISKLNGTGVGLDSTGLKDKVPAKASGAPLKSDKVNSANRSAITLFGIATKSNPETLKCFERLSTATGGKSYNAPSSSQISEIIEEIINVQIPEKVEDASSSDSSSGWHIDVMAYVEMIVYYIQQVFFFLLHIITLGLL